MYIELQTIWNYEDEEFTWVFDQYPFLWHDHKAYECVERSWELPNRLHQRTLWSRWSFRIWYQYQNNSSNPLSYIIKVIETSNNLLESLSLEDVFNGMILDGYDHDGIIAYSIDTMGIEVTPPKHTPNDFLFRNL